MNYCIGLDVGCTNIKGLAVTPSGKVLSEISVPTEGQGEWSRNVREAFKALERRCGSASSCVGIAAPGLPSADGGCIAHMPGRLPGLENLEWQQFLGCSFPVPVLNDAQAALLGEAWLGAARDSRNVMFLTLGTGVGGAAMVDGHLLRGHIGRAGHFGHISLDLEGQADVTGMPGSLEALVGDCTVKERSRNRFDSTRALVAAARNGDRTARRVWTESVRALAAGVASLINVVDPEVVVLGGGIVRAGPMLFRPLKSFLERYEWRPGRALEEAPVRKPARMMAFPGVPVVRARLGERAGAFGAAWNALQRHRQSAPHTDSEKRCRGELLGVRRPRVVAL